MNAVTPAELSRVAQSIADACIWLQRLRQIAASIHPDDRKACDLYNYGGKVLDWEGEGTLYKVLS